jgi:hypothetical protein
MLINGDALGLGSSVRFIKIDVILARRLDVYYRLELDVYRLFGLIPGKPLKQLERASEMEMAREKGRDGGGAGLGAT